MAEKSRIGARPFYRRAFIVCLIADALGYLLGREPNAHLLWLTIGCAVLAGDVTDKAWAMIRTILQLASVGMAAVAGAASGVGAADVDQGQGETVKPKSGRSAAKMEVGKREPAMGKTAACASDVAALPGVVTSEPFSEVDSNAFRTCRRGG